MQILWNEALVWNLIKNWLWKIGAWVFYVNFLWGFLHWLWYHLILQDFLLWRRNTFTNIHKMYYLSIFAWSTWGSVKAERILKKHPGDHGIWSSSHYLAKNDLHFAHKQYAQSWLIRLWGPIMLYHKRLKM